MQALFNKLNEERLWILSDLAKIKEETGNEALILLAD
jgi:hypothetical protein